MNEQMKLEAYNAIRAKAEENPLYQKSKSIHKKFQYLRFFDDANRPLNGQQIRREDANSIPEGADGFDEKTARIVIYNFVDGLLHSENDEPAVQYPNHWEFWNQGLLQKVVADGGDTEEYWKNGLPVRIDTNLAQRRKNGEEI